MEVDVETARKLREMGADELLEALRAQDDVLCMGMTCAERLQAAVDEAHSSFISQKVRNLTKRASLRYPEADVRSIDFSGGGAGSTGSQWQSSRPAASPSAATTSCS